MNFLRNHWFDLGMVFATVVGGYLLIAHPIGLDLLLWLSLVTLFLHQFEEYRFPGYFPGMMNKVMFDSRNPDRYPLNTNTAMIINVTVGWLSYFLAAFFGEKTLWLAIATIFVSAGNFVAHTFLFNIRGKSRYNPGMITADILFLPMVVYFFIFVIQDKLASPLDWIFGVLLGIALNYLGILKMIDLLKNQQSTYIFHKRFLIPSKK